MSSRGLSLREKASSYTPDFPSPLNPSSPEPPLNRCRRCRIARSEQSPTQKLMRHKAAMAWRSMVYGDGLLKASIQRTRDEIFSMHITDANEQDEQEEEDGPPAQSFTTTNHDISITSIEKYGEFGPSVRNVDTEKQGLIGHDYRGISLETSSYLSHLLTTRRLATAVGFVLFIGILSAVRAIGRIQAWRTW